MGFCKMDSTVFKICLLLLSKNKFQKRFRFSKLNGFCSRLSSLYNNAYNSNNNNKTNPMSFKDLSKVL